MTQGDRDTLRGVHVELQNLVDEILAEAPLKEAKEVVSGVHDDSTLAHCASITVGYIGFAQAIKRILSLPGTRSTVGVNVLARSVADIPKSFQE